jgi:hypothetical protein
MRFLPLLLLACTQAPSVSPPAPTKPAAVSRPADAAEPARAPADGFSDAPSGPNGSLRCKADPDFDYESSAGGSFVLRWAFTHDGGLMFGPESTYAITLDGRVVYKSLAPGGLDATNPHLGCIGRVPAESVASLGAALAPCPLRRGEAPKPVRVRGPTGPKREVVAIDVEPTATDPRRCHIRAEKKAWQHARATKKAREAFEQLRRELCGAECPLAWTWAARTSPQTAPAQTGN